MIIALVGAVFFAGFMLYLFGGGIEQQVAADSVKRCQIAKANGNAIDAHVHASLVAAAYLQAGDEDNYKKWKAIEKQEARNAGIPIDM